MAQITIDRLALKLSGLSASQGRRLTELIAAGLAAAPAPPGAPKRIDTLTVDFAPAPGSSLESLAEQVTNELLKQLRSTL